MVGRESKTRQELEKFSTWHIIRGNGEWAEDRLFPLPLSRFLFPRGRQRGVLPCLQGASQLLPGQGGAMVP